MDTIENAFNNYLEVLPLSILATIVSLKLRKRGIILTDEQVGALKKSIAETKTNTVRYEYPDGSGSEISIEISDSDLILVGKTFDKFINTLEPKVEDITTVLSKKILESLPKTWRRGDRIEDKIKSQLKRDIQQRWGKAISQLKMLLSISREYCSKLINKQSKTATPYLREVLFRLHARSCQVTEEIIILLSSGLADGAIARWRTLHEISTISLFISNNDEDLAERFLLHETIERHRAAIEYKSYQYFLGAEPLEEEAIQEIHQSKEMLIARFGQSYRNPYGWAAKHINNESPRFTDIEIAAGVSHLRPHYRFASHNVHANPSSIFFKLGLTNESKLLLAGPSNLGLAEVGPCTAISLTQTTTSLLTLYQSIDSIIFMKVMNALGDQIDQSFMKAHQKLLTDITIPNTT